MEEHEVDAAIIDPDCIEVFISSSMRDEGDFSWSKLRGEINSALAQSDLFKPFVIENHASIEPSASYYLNRLAGSDLAVGLIRSELRTGTNRELRWAIARKKPLLLIKIGDETTPDIDSLFRYARESDSCTYVKRANADDLVPYLMNQLNNVLVLLFRERCYSITDDGASAFANSAPVVISENVLDAFGESTALIAKQFGFHANWLVKECENPCLEAFGKKAVDWLLTGKPFSIAPFKNLIFASMEGSGIPKDTLSFRLDALDSYINGRYSNCYDKLQLACDSLETHDSWVYGNCLIDMRNVANLVSSQGVSAQFSIQKQIEALPVPSYFPLALKFEEAIGTTVLKAIRDAAATNPYTTVRYDNSLASVLANVSCLLFSSFLYGCIASAAYSRCLLANVFIHYSNMYNRPNLELEAIQLLVLAGDASGFEKRFQYKSDSLESCLPSCAEDLWRLTGLTPGAHRSSIRAAVVFECAPYFLDTTVCEVWSALSDVDAYRGCQSKWIKAINAIKMRVDKESIIEMLCRIVDEHLYVIASDVSKVIRGMNMHDFDDQLVNQLAISLKRNSSELLRGNFDPAVFAGVEDCCGFVLLSDSQVVDLPPVGRGCYMDRGDSGCDAEKDCVAELRRQFDENNSSVRHYGFATRPSSLLCQSLDGDLREFIEAPLVQVLEHCLKELPSYKGSPCSADEVATVLNKYVCSCLQEERQLPEGWVELIAALPNDWPEDPVFRDPGSMDSCAWSVRVRALKAAAGLISDIDFIAFGIKFATLSAVGQRAFLETFAQLMECGRVRDAYADVVSAICASVFLDEDSRIRALLMVNVATAYRRWRLSSLSDLAYRAVHDVSSEVVFRVVRLCKDGQFGDAALEKKLLDEASNDSNWFIRWHVEND